MYRLLVFLFITLCSAQPWARWLKRINIIQIPDDPIDISPIDLGGDSSASPTTIDTTIASAISSDVFSSTSSLDQPAATSSASPPSISQISVIPSEPIQLPVTLPSASQVYQIFATGSGDCKQGFIGSVNAPTCWTSTCGVFTELKIRQIYNASITMYTTNACTGRSDKVNPLCSVGDIEQDCGFAAGRRFKSFRVMPGCTQNDSNDVCGGSLVNLDCAATNGSCMATAVSF